MYFKNDYECICHADIKLHNCIEMIALKVIYTKTSVG